MTVVLAILGFALLFAAFGAIGSRLRGGACHGCPSEDPARCGRCPTRNPAFEETDLP